MFFRRKRKRATTLAPSRSLPAAAPEIRQDPGLPRKKILVADDDEFVLQVVSHKLKSQGYQVSLSSDCAETLALARREKPDLMLLDVHFASEAEPWGGVPWNGFNLTEWLRRTHAPDLPVILMSANDRPEYPQRACAVGATAFLPKTATGKELLNSIDVALKTSPGNESGFPA